MPSPVANLTSMRKHLTKAEIEARAAQEEAMTRDEGVTLTPPDWIVEDEAALRYWETTTERMAGISLLDDVDAHMLAVYCQMLARRDQLARQYNQFFGVVTLDKLQAQERQLLTYADKLGLTPSSRARLAKRRAEESPDDPDGDLFD